jgi:hypothetical protein
MAIERIVIENFKGIKKLDLEVRPFTVLIGPQSVGKSTTAKLLYYFKDIVRETIQAAIAEPESSLESHLIKRFLNFLPPPTRKSGKSVIRYSVGKEVFLLTSGGTGDSNWCIELPKIFRDEFAAVKNEISKPSKQTDDARYALEFNSEYKFRGGLKKKLGPHFFFAPQFIPAGRSFYAHIEKDPVSFFERATLDPFIAEFGKRLSRLKDDFSRALPRPDDKRPKVAQRAAQLAEQLLSGRYQPEGNRDFIIIGDGQRIPGALWSSGQQESFPLVFFLYRLCQFGLIDESLFVEEPEAHLFPASQRNMVELLALAFNARAGKLTLFITTHSPYILSTLNVLLRAGQLGGNKLNNGANGGVVNPLEALASNSVGSYYMDQNECHSIIDTETGLIDGSGIDDVSGEIAEQFDALNSLQ